MAGRQYATMLLAVQIVIFYILFYSHVVVLRLLLCYLFQII